MDIFNKDFVKYVWDESLIDKDCFVADDIDTLKSIVNSESPIAYEIEKNPGGIGFKGTVNERTWNFAYYDPNYELKVKFERGYTIQTWEDYDAGEDSYEDTHTGHWEDCKNPTWGVDKKYRVKPDEEGYLSPKEREMYKNAISKLYKKTGISLYNETDLDTNFENWWQKAITTYTMPPDVNKHWCKLAYMAALGIG